ncbi:hypothetical protein BU16DRAFT_121081 [Lophium mytilinum]|uniref:Myb-like domain-containing protein n=1 Tax=Lophium mytilinum TaxID=390894 RepID=A0A6A6QHI7_9PEZI|nr:hypothetical protein BU16DRAFT_121081 [Lophium mytilinum]
MEPARDAPWAEHEKLYLLAEIIKAAPIPSSVLYGIIRDAQIQPKWSDIALPHGRSLRSCQQAFDNLAPSYPGADYRQRPPLPAPVVGSYPGPEVPKKRPLQPETSTPIGRLLQPRPPHSYPGEYTSGPTYVMSPVTEPANKKKRGRPTKAEAQARADAAAARGEVYPPPRKQRTSLPSVEPSPLPSGRMTPGPAPMASMVTTPQVPHMEVEESSSGKRKRQKPSPLELERGPRGEAVIDTESPSLIGSASAEGLRPPLFSQQYTPASAAPYSATDPRDRDRDRERDRDRDVRMEGVEDPQQQHRTTTPRSFKDTVGI